MIAPGPVPPGRPVSAVPITAACSRHVRGLAPAARSAPIPPCRSVRWARPAMSRGCSARPPTSRATRNEVAGGWRGPCDGSGARRTCTCVASGSGSQGTWACASGSASCGVACGDHRCLPGEICINFGQYGGTFVDGGLAEPRLTPTCTVVPDACAGKSPSCAACIVPVYGCSAPGVCRDVGPETFDCILGGA